MKNTSYNYVKYLYSDTCSYHSIGLTYLIYIQYTERLFYHDPAIVGIYTYYIGMDILSTIDFQIS